jgi:PEGA domain
MDSMQVPSITNHSVVHGPHVGGLAAGVVAGVLLACQPARAPGLATVSLRMHGTPPSATVVVDEEALGTLEFVAAHGVALPPGTHHVTVKAAGYFPSDTAVDAQPGSAPVALEIALVPVPD